jgi:zinc protease
MKIIKSSFWLFLIVCSTQFSFGQTTEETPLTNVLNAYFKAVGGKEKARKIKSLVVISKGDKDNRKVVFTKKTFLPNKYISSMEVDNLLVSQLAFNGTTGYTLQNDHEVAFNSKEIKKNKLQRSIFPEFKYYQTATYVGKEEVNGISCHVIKSDETTIYYDAETGLKIKGETINTFGDQSFTQHIYYSKYAAIEGILFPLKTTIIANDQKLELQNSSILINRDLKESDFN